MMVYPEPAATNEPPVTDVYGNALQNPAPSGIPVRGMIQPSSSADMAAEGQVTGEFIRFICQSFPGGPWARVTWDNRNWDVVGVPVRRYGFRSLAHVTVTLKARFDRPTGEPR